MSWIYLAPLLLFPRLSNLRSIGIKTSPTSGLYPSFGSLSCIPYHLQLRDRILTGVRFKHGNELVRLPRSFDSISCLQLEHLTWKNTPGPRTFVSMNCPRNIDRIYSTNSMLPAVYLLHKSAPNQILTKYYERFLRTLASIGINLNGEYKSIVRKSSTKDKGSSSQILDTVYHTESRYLDLVVALYWWVLT